MKATEVIDYTERARMAIDAATDAVIEGSSARALWQLGVAEAAIAQIQIDAEAEIMRRGEP